MTLSIYHDALRLARQHDDEQAIRSLRATIARLRDDEMMAEMAALGPTEALRRIRLVAQEPTYSGAVARRVLRQLQPAAFEQAVDSQGLR
jgi:hypothetical protein